MESLSQRFLTAVLRIPFPQDVHLIQLTSLLLSVLNELDLVC